MMKRLNIDIEWLKEHNACSSFCEWFKYMFKTSKKIKIELLIEILHISKKPIWEGWLLIQKLNVTETAVEKGADISVCDSLVLRWSAQNGYLKLIKHLVKKGSNLRIFSDLLLFLAAERGHLKMVEYLLVKGLDIHAQNDCALRWAVKKNNSELVKFLIAKGANICACDEDTLKQVLEK